MKALAIAMALFATTAAATTAAHAETHEVKMMNRSDGGAMVYEPSYLHIAPGDTVKFIPTDPSHNAQTIDGMIPEGAEAFRSKISQEFEVALEVPGNYGIKCTPHFGMGMVMLIQVGDDAPAPVLAEKLPKRAKDRFDEILAAMPQ